MTAVHSVTRGRGAGKFPVHFRWKNPQHLEAKVIRQNQDSREAHAGHCDDRPLAPIPGVGVDQQKRDSLERGSLMIEWQFTSRPTWFIVLLALVGLAAVWVAK